MMKNIFLIIFFTVSNLTHALDSKEYSSDLIAHIEKVKTYMRKGNKCYISYVRINKSLKYAGDIEVMGCISDIERGKGINAQSGCSLVKYNAGTDQYQNFSGRYFQSPMSNKPCMEGGYEDLLKMKGHWINIKKPLSVEEAIFTPIDYYKYEYILIDSKYPKFEKWFNEKSKHYTKIQNDLVDEQELKEKKEKEAKKKKADLAAEKEKKRLAAIKNQEKRIKKKLKKNGVKLEYVYHQEWKVYSVPGRSLTKVNSSAKWDIPRTKCHLGPEEIKNKKVFKRSFYCGNKKLGEMECIAKEQERTKCEKNFGLASLYITIKRFPTMGTRRALELERELENETPY